MKTLSIIIPVFNEAENLPILFSEIERVKKVVPDKVEVIFINDGSTDQTQSVLVQIQRKHAWVKMITFTRNFGQAAAFDAGIKAARGDILATLDADLQNDPADLPKLLTKLETGFDAVVGWRKQRKDRLEKKLFSQLANWLRVKLTGETIHDSGCSLRVYKREVFQNIDLYGEMHRFIPALLFIQGYRIGEVEVHHRPRIYGKSKYNIKRVGKGLLDLLFISFLTHYGARPLHIFGLIGGGTFIFGVLIAGYLSWLKLAFGEKLANRPLLTLSVLLIIIGTQFVSLGFLAEILMRIYFKTHNIKPYTFKKS